MDLKIAQLRCRRAAAEQLRCSESSSSARPTLGAASPGRRTVRADVGECAGSTLAKAKAKVGARALASRLLDDRSRVWHCEARCVACHGPGACTPVCKHPQPLRVSAPPGHASLCLLSNFDEAPMVPDKVRSTLPVRALNPGAALGVSAPRSGSPFIDHHRDRLLADLLRRGKGFSTTVYLWGRLICIPHI